MNRRLVAIRLLDPTLCMSCRFKRTAEVLTEDGKRRELIRCRRHDCDNWDMSTQEAIVEIREIEE